MKINIFDSTFDKPSLDKSIQIDEFLEGVQAGRWKTAAQRVLLAKNKDEKDSFKKKTPAVTISGWFEGKRSKDTVRQHSGFICIDLDHVENIEETFQSLKNSEYTYSLFRSISGKGLAWIVKIDPLKHQEAFEGLSSYVFNLTGANADPACKDVSRLRFVSFDPHLFRNEKSKVFKQYIKKETKAAYKQRTNYPDLDRFHEVLNKINCDITGDYHQWLKIGFAIASKYDLAGFEYFDRLSSFSGSYNHAKCKKQYEYCCRNFSGSGINIGTFYYYAKQAGFEAYDEKEKAIIKQAVQAKQGGRKKESAEKVLSGIGQLELQEQDKQLLEKAYEESEKFEQTIQEDKKKGLDVNAVEAYIKAHWDIKKNVLNHFYELDGQRMEPEDWNSIYISCKKVFPEVSKELVLSMIRSDSTKKYNPVTDYLNHLAWDKVDRVSALTASLKSCTGSFEYQNKLLCRWLLGFIQNLYSDDACPLMLVLTGSKNTGKTYFFKYLLPKRLKAYFGTSQHDREKDDDLLMTQKLLILDDEFSGKSKQDAKKMKRLLSTSYFDLRPPYGSENVQLKRIAMLAGTCNELEVLNDPTGNRRFIVFEINDRMDWEEFNKVDKDQLFAQLKAYWDAGYTGDLEIDEIEAMEAQTTSRHSEVSIEEELIIKYFDTYNPHGYEEYTNTEIKVYLESKTGQRLSSRKLGLELKKLGFPQKIVKSGSVVARKYTISKNPLYKID